MPDEEDVTAHDVRRLGLTRLQKLGCGPGHPELSNPYMDMASKFSTFTFTFTKPCCRASGASVCVSLMLAWLSTVGTIKV